MSRRLNSVLQDELGRVIPVIQNSFTFAVSYNAAQKLLVGRAESGPYMIAITMTALLLLLGAQLRCKECQDTYATKWFKPIFSMLVDLLTADINMGTAFVSNLFALVLVSVLSEALNDAWVIWWAAVGLALTNIAIRFVA